MKVFVILALALVARAEPPVDSFGMYPPARNAPSSSYGAPGFGGQNGHDSNHGLTGARFTGFDRMAAPSSQYGAPAGGSAGGFGGYANARNSYDDMSEPASYEYKYEVNDAASGSEFGHKEQRDGDVAHGEYRVLLPDGRTQVVTYMADQNGYQPTITYLESQGGYPSGPASGRGGQGGPY